MACTFLPSKLGQLTQFDSLDTLLCIAPPVMKHSQVCYTQLRPTDFQSCMHSLHIVIKNLIIQNGVEH